MMWETSTSLPVRTPFSVINSFEILSSFDAGPWRSMTSMTWWFSSCTCNELITYEALGLCGEGKAGEFVDSGAVTYGGKWVVNPSGGLKSKGHPIGATGVSMHIMTCLQLMGEAGGMPMGVQVAARPWRHAHSIR